jgi:glycerol-3-phosphate dehydrogenase subunit B
VEALERKDPCLLVGIEGLRGYSARKIKETLGHRWPGLSTATIRFPETEAMVEVYTEPMARALEVDQTRAALAERIRPHLQGARVVGLPAILGIYRTDEVMADLEAQLGVPLFEIPTMPPSLPGVRMREALENNLARMGIRHYSGRKVTDVQKIPQGFTLEITGSDVPSTIHAKRVVLATGRFLGRGLRADRKKIREALFNLPIYQPLERANWHRRTFLNPHGHLINQAGVEVDDLFRPVDGEKKPLYANLYAAGTILAHQDWIRAKCGSGLSIATAYAAVEACLQ